jgi:hypothetical protein
MFRCAQRNSQRPVGSRACRREPLRKSARRCGIPPGALPAPPRPSAALADIRQRSPCPGSPSRAQKRAVCGDALHVDRHRRSRVLHHRARPGGGLTCAPHRTCAVLVHTCLCVRVRVRVCVCVCCSLLLRAFLRLRVFPLNDTLSVPDLAKNRLRCSPCAWAGRRHPCRQAGREQARCLCQRDSWRQKHVHVGGQNQQRLRTAPPRARVPSSAVHFPPCRALPVPAARCLPFPLF